MLLKTLHLIFYLLPTFLFAQFVDSSAENYKAFYYENGTISSEGYLLEGKPNAYWITYYPNELRKSEGNRVDFKLDGLWKFYDKKGNIKNSIVYANDLKNGPYVYYNEDCLAIKEENYKNDTLSGLSYLYYPDTSINKVIKEKIPYAKGKLEGTAFEYARDGRLITIKTYKKGFKKSTEKINRFDKAGRKQNIWKTYYSNSRLKKEERYKDDLLNGYVKEYNKQGKLEKATLYINGVEQSMEENVADFDIRNDYYSDGSVKKTTTYNLAGKKEGVSNSFDNKGKVTATEIYRNGYLLKKGIIDKKGIYQGLWETYYLSGKLKTKGEYKNGKKYGKWTYYFVSGKVEQEGFYDEQGLYTNEWKWYYENGKLLRKEEYRKGIEDGYLEEFDKEGDLITSGEFFDGEREGEWFYKLNDHEEIGKFRYGQRNGYWEFKYSNGKTSFEGNYVDGEPEGKHKYYNTAGVLIREENYSYGKKDGKWKWYDSFGAELMSITYKEGVEKKINGQKVKL